MAMQTREQHIRREKANRIFVLHRYTGNIAAMWYIMGLKGLKNIAQRIHRLTDILAAGLIQNGHYAIRHGLIL